ncbi:MAG: Crp/Fnr family transcriptional regulator [Firmicutes bacterium]|nr:Crp/Fnr family transcriptional regulator [Bacillota bacterium]
MFKKWIGVLASCKLFDGIDSREIEDLLDCLKPRLMNYGKNDMVAIAGERFEEFGLVLAGTVAVTKENAVGDRIIIDILGPGQMFGEIAVFAGNNLWPATVVAQTACAVAFMSPDVILGTCKKQCINHKRLIINMLRIISGKALLLNQKLQYLSMKSIRRKLSSYLLEQHKKQGQTTFMMPLKRNELAEFLNVTRPSLSREMCKMRNEGIIEFHRESIKIRDLDALKSL